MLEYLSIRATFAAFAKVCGPPSDGARTIAKNANSRSRIKAALQPETRRGSAARPSPVRGKRAVVDIAAQSTGETFPRASAGLKGASVLISQASRRNLTPDPLPCEGRGNASIALFFPLSASERG